MLTHKITIDEINSLCTLGKTPVIDDFVSSKTHKKFSASLILDQRRGIAFEFAKRTAGTKKTAAKDGKTENPEK